MGLSLAGLSSKAAVFKQINMKFGKRGGGRTRKWTAADLTYNRPSNDQLGDLDTTAQFAVDLGNPSGSRLQVILVVPLDFPEHGIKQRRLPVGWIEDK
jgi:hypothetical protein